MARTRTLAMTFYVSPDERDSIANSAWKARKSISAYLRSLALGEDAPTPMAVQAPPKPLAPKAVPAPDSHVGGAQAPLAPSSAPAHQAVPSAPTPTVPTPKEEAPAPPKPLAPPRPAPRPLNPAEERNKRIQAERFAAKVGE